MVVYMCAHVMCGVLTRNRNAITKEVTRRRRDANNDHNANGKAVQFYIDSRGQLAMLEGKPPSLQQLHSNDQNYNKDNSKNKSFARTEFNLLNLLNRRKRSFKILTTITIKRADGRKEKRYVVLHKNVRKYLTKAQLRKKPRRAPIFGYWTG